MRVDEVRRRGLCRFAPDPLVAWRSDRPGRRGARAGRARVHDAGVVLGRGRGAGRNGDPGARRPGRHRGAVSAAQRAQELREAFTGVISHELRTPITTIYGMSQVLRQRHRTMDPDALGQMIEDIEGEADRLRRLAEDLLVLSRTESGRLEVTLDPVLMGHLVRRRVADEAAHWPAHRFVAEVPPGLGLVLGEEMYVEQVLQNLLSNAAKYSPAGIRGAGRRRTDGRRAQRARARRGDGHRGRGAGRNSSSCSTARRMLPDRQRVPASACSCAVS